MGILGQNSGDLLENYFHCLFHTQKNRKLSFLLVPIKVMVSLKKVWKNSKQSKQTTELTIARNAFYLYYKHLTFGSAETISLNIKYHNKT